jgi:hypothetical protein
VPQTFAGVPDTYSGRLYSGRTSATCSPSPSDLSQLDFKMEAEDCYTTYHQPHPAAPAQVHPQHHNHHGYDWQHYGAYYQQPAAPQPVHPQAPHPQAPLPQAPLPQPALPQAYEQPMDTYSLPPFPSVSTTALTPRQRRASLPLQRSESTR